MHFNLEMLNVWLGLCRGDSALPNDLRDLDYKDRGIERRFKNSNQRNVKPELIVASDVQAHCLMLEWKSGKNVNTEQLDRYLDVEPDNLVRLAGQARASVVRHDVALVIDGPHEQHVTDFCRQAKYDVPIVVRTPDGLRLASGTFGANEITACLSNELAIDWSKAPRQYVPVDTQSSNFEIANVLAQPLLQAMATFPSKITARDLVPGIFPLTWREIGSEDRKGLEAKVKSVLRDAAARELARWLEWDHGALIVRSNPYGPNNPNQGRDLQRLLTAQTKLLDRLRSTESQLKFEFND